MDGITSDKACVTVGHVKRNDWLNIYTKYHNNEVSFRFLELKAAKYIKSHSKYIQNITN